MLRERGEPDILDIHREMGEPDILVINVCKALMGSFACAMDMTMHTGSLFWFKHALFRYRVHAKGLGVP